jgi:hypothetical protein
MTMRAPHPLRDYLAEHSRRDDAIAPLFPAMAMRAPRPTRSTADDRRWRSGHVGRQKRRPTALAELSVADAEGGLALDWTAPPRHAAFYKAVFRPAVFAG